jgi:hypothetical protein
VSTPPRDQPASSARLAARRHDGGWLRVCHHGHCVADTRSVAELERWLQLADVERDTLALAA